MAEIKIEKKKPIWPWILLLVILALAATIYFMTQDSVEDDLDDDIIENIDDVESDDMESGLDNIEDSDSITYADGYSRQEADRIMMDYRTSLMDSAKVGADSQYTINALSQLLKAVEIKSKQFDVDAAQTIDSLEMKLGQTQGLADESPEQSNPSEVANMPLIKETTTSMVGIMKTVQQKRFPNLSNEILELQQNLSSLGGNLKLAEQQKQINFILNRAADVLNKMN